MGITLSYPNIMNLESGLRYNFNSGISLGYSLTSGFRGLGVILGAKINSFKIQFPIIYSGNVSVENSLLSFLGITLHYLVLAFLIPKFVNNSSAPPAEPTATDISSVRKAKSDEMENQIIMKNIAQRKMAIEEENKGLVIRRALFGKKSILEEYQQSQNRYLYLSQHNFSDPRVEVIDVTIPLQFNVSESSLKLLNSRKRSHIGFMLSLIHI
eukprot:TRINITY_DN65452_c0_g1_i2.p2 TRINITY_DN65452_c0_g1~~TRINITY_DN65452_c0_g1_i2.p2  ORF type:complete len:212 (+),score=30.14 TRINITY_DN65452_c0_g1_i2:205-840(+)